MDILSDGARKETDQSRPANEPHFMQYRFPIPFGQAFQQGGVSSSNMDGQLGQPVPCCAGAIDQRWSGAIGWKLWFSIVSELVRKPGHAVTLHGCRPAGCRSYTAADTRRHPRTQKILRSLGPQFEKSAAQLGGHSVAIGEATSNTRCPGHSLRQTEDRVSEVSPDGQVEGRCSLSEHAAFGARDASTDGVIAGRCRLPLCWPLLPNHGSH